MVYYQWSFLELSTNNFYNLSCKVELFHIVLRCHMKHFCLLLSKFLLAALYFHQIHSRRDLAPHLKSLMGPWWFSQFDAVYEVSQAAKRSLQVSNCLLYYTILILRSAWIILPNLFSGLTISYRVRCLGGFSVISF